MLDWSAFWVWNGWTAVAAIAQVLAATATFAAVLVALKQTRDSHTPRVDVKVSNGFPVMGPVVGNAIFIFSAVNVGVVPVTLTSTGIHLPDGNSLFLFEETSGKFPCKLQPGEGVEYFVDIRKLASTLHEHGYQGNMRLRVRFTDAQGRNYYRRFRINTWEWLRSKS